MATLTDGSFGSLGGFTYFGEPLGARVIALAHAGGRLYAAGEFTAVGDVAVEHWAMHDGTGWSVPAALDNAVMALAAHGDGVVVAGPVRLLRTPLRLPHAGIWTGAGWQTFGQGLALRSVRRRLRVRASSRRSPACTRGGFFDQAGPLPAGSMAEWRDGAWHDMAGGLRTTSTLGRVYAMLRVGTDLYVTGTFESAGRPRGGEHRALGRHAVVAAGQRHQRHGPCLVVLGGRLYVGGSFFAAGGVPAYNVASWDPAAETWSAVGSAPVYDGAVLSLAAIDDRHLVVGGQFSKQWMGHVQVSGLNALVLFDTHAPPDPANPFAGYSRILRESTRVVARSSSTGPASRRGPSRRSRASPPRTSRSGTSPPRRGPGRPRAPSTGRSPRSPRSTDARSSSAAGSSPRAARPRRRSSSTTRRPGRGRRTAAASAGASQGAPTVHALAQSPADGLWVGGAFTVAGGAPSCNLALWRARRAAPGRGSMS